MFGRIKVAMIVAEVFGTAVLTMVILVVSRSTVGVPYFIALAAGLTLAGLALTIGPASGAHLNPALTLGLWTVRKIQTNQAIIYIAAQFLGALLAWRLYVYITESQLETMVGSKLDWRVLAAEAAGAMVFVFAATAALFRNFDTGRTAAVVGIALAVGVVVASAKGEAIINPAVAMSLRSWNAAYIAGPLIGGVLGANLFGLVFAEQSVLPARVTKQKPVAKKRR